MKTAFLMRWRDVTEGQTMEASDFLETGQVGVFTTLSLAKLGARLAFYEYLGGVAVEPVWATDTQERCHGGVLEPRHLVVTIVEVPVDDSDSIPRISYGIGYEKATNTFFLLRRNAEGKEERMTTDTGDFARGAENRWGSLGDVYEFGVNTGLWKAGEPPAVSWYV